MFKYLIISSVLAYASATPIATFLTPAGTIAYSPSGITNYVAPESQSSLVQFTYPSLTAAVATTEIASSQLDGISRITEYDAIVVPPRYYAVLPPIAAAASYY